MASDRELLLIVGKRSGPRKDGNGRYLSLTFLVPDHGPGRAGYSYAEIEARMAVSKSTIEKHIARAVLTLMDAKEQE